MSTITIEKHVVNTGVRKEYYSFNHQEWDELASAVGCLIHEKGNVVSFEKLNESIDECSKMHNASPHRLFNHFLSEEILKEYYGDDSPGLESNDFSEDNICRIAERVFERFNVNSENSKLCVVNYFLKGRLQIYIWSIQRSFINIVPDSVKRCLNILDELPKHVAQIKEYSKKFRMNVDSVFPLFEDILKKCNEYLEQNAEKEVKKRLGDKTSGILEWFTDAVFSGDSGAVNKLRLQLRHIISEVFPELDDDGKNQRLVKLATSYFEEVLEQFDRKFDIATKCAKYGLQVFFNQISSQLQNASSTVSFLDLANTKSELQELQDSMNHISIPLSFEDLEKRSLASLYVPDEDLKILKEMKETARNNLGKIASFIDPKQQALIIKYCLFEKQY